MDVVNILLSITWCKLARHHHLSFLHSAIFVENLQTLALTSIEKTLLIPTQEQVYF